MHLQCTHCDRTFTKTEHLRRHERSHTKEKPFECHVCHKTYARSDVLARHIRMHQRKDEEGSDETSPSAQRQYVEGRAITTPTGTPYPLPSGPDYRHHQRQSPPAKYPLQIHATPQEQPPSQQHYKENGKYSNGFANLNPSDRFNMPARTSDLSAYSNSPNGHYASYPSMTTLVESRTDPASGPPFSSLLPSLAKYDSPLERPNDTSCSGSTTLPPCKGLSTFPMAQYPTNGYDSTLQPEQPPAFQITYNYPPAPRHDPEEGQATPVFPEVVPWQDSTTVKDQTESNVRGSGPQPSSLGDNASKFEFRPTSTVNEYKFRPADQYSTQQQQPSSTTSRTLTPATYEPGNSNDSRAGLQKWLAVSQQSNPVNAILGFENGHRSLTPLGTSLWQQVGARESEDVYRRGGLLPSNHFGLGRYAKVEQTWYSRLSSQGRWPGTEKRWYDVLQGMSGDLFGVMSPSCEVLSNGQRARVSEACRLRMINAIYPRITNPYDPASATPVNDSDLEEVYNRFPDCSAFDTALDHYFSVFAREAPFLHLPAFSISTCSPLLLFVMSCVGFGLLKTNEGCHFVQGNFDRVRDCITGELEKKLTSTTKDAMSTFATSFIFLKLAALINDRDHLSPCQLLYFSLVSLAQMHGLFSEYGKRTTVDIYSGLNTLSERWLAWGRVESLKRISVSLMRLDSAYATFLRSTPVARVSNIEILLPCDDRLFEAPTAEAWYALLENEQLPMIMPSISTANSMDKLVGHTYLNYYSLHAVLNYLQLRSLDAYQKLLDYQARQDADQFVLVPFQYYITEPSLHNMTLHVVAFVDSYQTLLPRFPSEWQKTNCLVFWHFLCLSLTMNQDLFEIAAGREGPKAAASAIDSIAMWATTAAARRALIHSASIYQLLSVRTQNEMSSLYVAFATFAGALVMTLYVFANPSQSVEESPYELTSPVDWGGFGLAGLNESASTTNGSAAENFILHGGPSVFNGRVLQGFNGARYVLNLYADMLKTCGRYNYRQMSQILFMMSDLLYNEEQ